MPVVSYGPRILACGKKKKKREKGELDNGCSGAGGSNAARRDWTETSGSSGNGRRGRIMVDCSKGTVFSCWMKERKSGRSCGNGLIF